MLLILGFAALAVPSDAVLGATPSSALGTQPGEAFGESVSTAAT